MLRITIAAVLAISLSATAAPLPPGIERAASAPVPSINNSYARSGAVTADGFTVMLQAGLRVYSNEVPRLATTPEGRAEPLQIPRFTEMAGLPGGIVTAWADGAKLYSSISSKPADVTVRRELPVHDTHLPILDSVTTNRTHAMVLAYDYDRKHAWASVLSSSGVPAGPEADIIPRGTVSRLTGLATGSDPGGFLALYRDEQQPSTLFATRVTNGGTVTRFALPLQLPVGDVLAAFDGTRYLVTLQRGASVDGFLTTPDGSSRSAIFPITSDGYLAAIVGRAGGSLLIFSGKAFTFEHISRTQGPTQRIAARPNFVLSDGRHVLAAYANNSAFPVTTASAQWLDLNSGAPLTDSFALSYGSAPQAQPVAALGNTVDLLVWAERDPDSLDDAIRATRIARDGRRLDDPALLLSLPGTLNARAAVGFNGRDFVVAWHEQSGTPGQSSLQRVRIQRVSEDGRLLEPSPREIGTALFTHSDLEVAQVGETTLVLWLGPAGNSFQVLGRRMNRAGALLDPAPLRLTAEATSQHWTFDLTTGAGNFFVAWAQSDIGENSVRAALITPAGSITAAQKLPNLTAHSQYRLHVGFNGTVFLVAVNRSFTMLTTIGWAYPKLELPVEGVLELGSIEGRWSVMYGPPWGSATGHVFLEGYNPHFLPFSGMQTAVVEEDVVDSRIASDGTRGILVYTRPIHDAAHAGSHRVMFRFYGDPPPPIRRRTTRF
jgi:hypothetical protein